MKRFIARARMLSRHKYGLHWSLFGKKPVEAKTCFVEKNGADYLDVLRKGCCVEKNKKNMKKSVVPVDNGCAG